MLKVENVSFSYAHGNTAVQDVDFEIGEGLIVGIAGHNGAGKTTLLRIVSGILEPDQGTVSFSSQMKKGGIAYIPDNGGFYSELTAIDNVLFRMQVARTGNSEEKALDYLEQVGLASCFNKAANTFSHGMKKRLAIACALSSQPRIVILDESLNGVDPESLDMTINLLRRTAFSGSTILISSHDLNMLEEICSTLLIMDHAHCVFFEPVNRLEESFKAIYLKTTAQN